MVSVLMRTAVAAWLILLAGQSPALAWRDGPPPLPGARLVALACHWDYARLCPGIAPGDGRILRCLSDQREALSPPCYWSLAAAAAIEACAGDYQRYCADVVPGAGRGITCLQANRDRLSPTCHRTLRAAAPHLFGRLYAGRSATPPLREEGPPPANEPPDLSGAPLK
jgi:hypothetical protein